MPEFQCLKLSQPTQLTRKLAGELVFAEEEVLQALEAENLQRDSAVKSVRREVEDGEAGERENGEGERASEGERGERE